MARLQIAVSIVNPKIVQEKARQIINLAGFLSPLLSAAQRSDHRITVNPMCCESHFRGSIIFVVNGRAKIAAAPVANKSRLAASETAALSVAADPGIG
jgi:hypothetical protein